MKFDAEKKKKEQFQPFVTLQKDGKIKPGEVISGQYLENLFGVKYSLDPKGWDFRGRWFMLKIMIESEGYFITQKGLDQPSFRILDTSEMYDHAHKKVMKNMASNSKVAYVLSAHPNKSGLSEKDKKKMEAMQKIAARSALAQNQILMEQVVF